MDSHSGHNEISLSGLPGAPGIVIGKASLYRRRRPVVSNISIDDDLVQQQVEQFHEARNRAEQELQQLLESQQEENAIELIHTQIEMINDPDLCKRVVKEITENNQPADSAIHKVFEEYLLVFKKHQEEVVRQRSIDISDIRDRLIQIVNNSHHATEIEEGAILVASELSPREVIEFSERNIKGIIMDHGGTTSHAAIIARSMNIPTVVGVKSATNMIDEMKMVVLDGENGEVIINPDTETQQRYKELIEEQFQAQSNMSQICDEPNETLDQQEFILRANIEFLEELEAVKKNRAQGVGLLRTESVYLRRNHFGGHEKQEQFYREILEHCSPEKVTIRLFDAGGDKIFNLSTKEQNPFLGWRGIRMLLDKRSLLHNQLKAILQAASQYKGCVRILVPMVTTVEEVLQVKEVVKKIESNLKTDGQVVDDQVQFGVMVEVPSVALQAETFAEHADFLSIGTNDLTQYVLAVDRGNERISDLYDQRHPAVWKLIKHVVEASQKKEVSLSVCGELASDPVAACGLMGMGINELSMNPAVLPAVKRMLRSHTLEEMQQLAENLLQSATMEDIKNIYANWNSI